MTEETPYRVVLTAEAERQLEEELARSRRMWSAGHQKKFGQELRDFIGRIARFPKMHRQRPESFGVRVAWFKTLRIAYFVNDETREMEVVAFIWRRELETVLNEIPEYSDRERGGRMRPAGRAVDKSGGGYNQFLTQ